MEYENTYYYTTIKTDDGWSLTLTFAAHESLESVAPGFDLGGWNVPETRESKSALPSREHGWTWMKIGSKHNVTFLTQLPIMSYAFWKFETFPTVSASKD